MNGGRSALGEGRYRLRSVIGEGGMGTVWSAERVADGADVAIKILKVQDVEQMQRLVREARIAQRLRHENVVRVDEILASASNAREAPALVMERLRGESLRERLARSERGRLPLGETARILLDVAGALEAAHALGIVHRDLKPENVFLHQAPASTVVKVLDFGIAKIVGASDLHTAGMTRTGTMLGTPYYMAPEQVFGEGDVDASADVWALGVVLFECLGGARPFSGDNPGQVFKAIAMAEPPSLRAQAPDLPDSVVALVTRMFARERAARPSLAEVRAALVPVADSQLAQLVVGAGDSSLVLAPTVEAAVLLAAAPTPGSFEVRADPPSRFGGARRVRAGLALVLATLATVTLVWLARRPAGDPNDASRLAPMLSAPATALATGLGPDAAVLAVNDALSPPPALAAPAAAAPSGLAATQATAAPSGLAATRAPSPTANPDLRARPKPAPASTLPGGVRAENPY